MAQQNPLGMFDVIGSTLPNPQSEQEMRQRALEYARLDEQQRTAFNTSMADQTLVGGIGQLARAGIGAATGQDVRTPAQQAQGLKEQIRAAMQGVDLSDPAQAYPRMIQVLQEAGMVGQAMAMTKEYEEITNKRRDDARNAAKDTETAAIQRLKIAQTDNRSPLQKNIDQLQAMYNRLSPMPAGPEKTALELATKRMAEAISRSPEGKVTVVDKGGVIEIVNGYDGSVIREVSKSVDPTARFKIESGKDAQKAMEAASNNADALALVAEAEQIVDGGTGSLLGTARDAIFGALGLSTPEAQVTAQLKVIAGNLLSKFEKLSGPVSDFEMKSYQAAQGDLGNPMTPIPQKKAALATMRKLYEARLARAPRTPSAASTSAPAPTGAPTMQFNPATGKLERI